MGISKWRLVILSHNLQQWSNSKSFYKYKGKIASILIMIRWSFLGLNWPNSFLLAPLLPWLYQSESQAAKSRFQAVNKSVAWPVQKSVFIRFKTKFPVFLIIKGKIKLISFIQKSFLVENNYFKTSCMRDLPIKSPTKSSLKAFIFCSFISLTTIVTMR